jgi:hypothetical protein
MDIEREKFSRECVYQGYYMKVSPHYLAAVAELRSGVSDNPKPAGPGPFCLSAEEWSANQDGGNLGFGFVSSDITDWRFQTQVFAYMTQQLDAPGRQAFGHPLNSLELYLCQLFGPSVAAAIAINPTAPVANAVLPAALQILDQRFPGLTQGTGDQTIKELQTALDQALNITAPLIQQAADDLQADPHNFVGQTFDQKAPQIMKRLMADLGLNEVHTGGILGNLGHESVGLRVMQEVNPIGGGRGGYGWAQWTGTRRDDFQAWCQQKNLAMDSDEGNYGFLCFELQGKESKSLVELQKTNTLSVATETFARLFERPGILHLSSRMNWARRATAAYAQS